MQKIDNIYTTLYAMRVDGVRTHLRYAPYTFTTAQYPLLFFRNIKFNLQYGSNLLNALDLSNGECEMVIVVEAFRQGTGAQNYELCRTLISAVADTINSSGILVEADGVEIKEDFELTGDTVLFVVIAKINFFV